MRHHYEVIVGNIGIVYSGIDIKVATMIYNHYVELALHEVGRAAGESVVLFKDGEIIKEHEGALTTED